MDMKQMQKFAMLAQKKHAEFEKKIFEFSEQQDMIKGTITGKYKITLDFDLENFLEEVGDSETAIGMIQTAINDQIEKVRKEERKILGSF